MPLFPPQGRKAFHKAVLAEILEERVVSSRGRQIPRGVKRKMSNFPLRRGRASGARRLNYSQHIKVLK
jgi:ribosomal protein L14E/L6E/L27E